MVAAGGLAQLKAEAQGLLAAFPPGQRPQGIPADTPLDLERLSEGVMARLCQLWFGQPDGVAVWGTELHPAGVPEAPRCPRDLFRVSRHVFGPHPSAEASQAGREAGVRFLDGIARWLAQTPAAQLPPLTRAILAAAAAVPGAPADLPARTLAGVMLGFPPTTHGNLLTVLAGWVQTRKLWELQPGWHEVPAAATDAQRYAEAVARLRPRRTASATWTWRRARPSSWAWALPRSRTRCATTPPSAATAPTRPAHRRTPARATAWAWASCWASSRRCWTPASCARRARRRWWRWPHN
jgi:hypothetical protein